MKHCQNRQVGGAEGTRTPDLLNAIQALYQLSYDPNRVEDQATGRRRLVKRFSVARPGSSAESPTGSGRLGLAAGRAERRSRVKGRFAASRALERPRWTRLVVPVVLAVMQTAALPVRGGDSLPAPPRRLRTDFLTFCDLAARELNKPLTPFYSRTDDDPTTHHIPFFEDAHAVRALAVAWEMTGRRRYLDACRRWSDLMRVYQRGMHPPGAYYMNHQRAPGQTVGQWNLADSASIGLGVLATAARCKSPAERERYLDSVRAFAKLAMDNYVRPGGGLSNGLWPEYDGPWWASTAIFGTLAFSLHAQTSESRFLDCGRAALRWLVRTDFRDFAPITFQQRPSGIIFYTFEFYLAGLPHFPAGTLEHQAVLAQFEAALEWMAQHQKSRGVAVPDYTEKNVDMAGLPYLMYGFARLQPRYRHLVALADGELDYIGRLLLERGEPNVSRLMVWEVMTWGMMSYAERLKPGALLLDSTQRRRSR